MSTTIRQSPAARLFNEAAWTLCNQIADDYGFTLSWEDDANGRVLMLLGPDSPSEMTMRSVSSIWALRSSAEPTWGPAEARAMLASSGPV